jgi:hypothetical protein
MTGVKVCTVRKVKSEGKVLYPLDKETVLVNLKKSHKRNVIGLDEFNLYYIVQRAVYDFLQNKKNKYQQLQC